MLNAVRAGLRIGSGRPKRDLMKTTSQARVERRRLAAILAADVAGYSRLIGADEGRTLKRFGAIRAEVMDPKIAEHHGRIVKTMGDGLLVEFTSIVDALRCAAEVQTAMAERNVAVAAGDRIEFRIGVNVGDVVVEEGDIFGDGVNVAACLEALAEPGGICISARVQEDAAGKIDLTFEDIGEQQLKNIARRPRERIGTPEQLIGIAHFVKRRFDDAASKLLLAIQDNPGNPIPYRFLAACYAHMGRLDEAHAIVARLRALTPQVMPSDRDLPWRNPENRELLLSGLRMATGQPH
jgi:class 3 adenylate cyclase